MNTNAVVPQTTDLSLYRGPVEVAEKTEDPHEQMRSLLIADAHVRDLEKNELEIGDMPAAIRALLKEGNETGNLELGLMDYMNQQGINSITFINLDDDGNVASIMTVTRSPDNARDLNFQHSEKTPGGVVSDPYTGNLHNSSGIDKFLEKLGAGNFGELKKLGSENKDITKDESKVPGQLKEKLHNGTDSFLFHRSELTNLKARFMASEKTIFDTESSAKTAPSKPHAKAKATPASNKNHSANNVNNQHTKAEKAAGQTKSTVNFRDQITQSIGLDFANKNGASFEGIEQTVSRDKDGNLNVRQSIKNLHIPGSGNAPAGKKSNINLSQNVSANTATTGKEQQEQGQAKVIIGKNVNGGTLGFGPNTEAHVSMGKGSSMNEIKGDNVTVEYDR
ncbi:hypothetical protein SC171_21330 [Pantoea cypripedii]|uniref:hypothetical protein n=1 Tax=Pantoea cypripedii TaxID=55209 RepID=UPI002FC6B6A3